MRIAVDIGGTFTDLVAVDDDGRVSRSKALTTPDDLARGIGDCLTGANVAVAGGPTGTTTVSTLDWCSWSCFCYFT